MKVKTMKTRYFALLILCVTIFSWSFENLMLGPVEEPMNPRITIDGDNNIDCNEINNNEVQSFDLSVAYTDAKSTESYVVNPIAYTPSIPFDQVADVSNRLNFDAVDRFSSELVSFFPFGFLENTSNQVAIGENGVISFDALQAGQDNRQRPEFDIPNPLLTRNSIFAAHTDFVFDYSKQNEGVFYKIIGAYPARQLVITYLNAQMFDCIFTNPNHRINVQVVLQETTNVISIFIEKKDPNCDPNYHSIVGIMNNSGTKGYVAPGRNYTDGNWSAQSEGWEFVPDGEKGPDIAWYEGAYSPENPIVGDTDKITVFTTPNEIYYTVYITYPNGVILSDEIKISEFIPQVKDIEINICDDYVDLTAYENVFSLVDPSNFDILYFSNPSLTNAINNPTQYTTTTGDVVYAKVMNRADNTCFETAKITLFKNTFPVPEDISICDKSGNQEELNLELHTLDSQIFNSTNNYEVVYYATATSNLPIAYIDIIGSAQVWVEIINDKCISDRLGPIQLTFASLPEIVVPATGIEVIMCDKQFNYAEPLDGFSNWKELLLDNGLILNDPTLDVSVHHTLSEAESNDNAISEIELDTNNPAYDILNNSISTYYYIRIQNEAGCYQTFNLPIQIRFYGVKATDAKKYICASDAVFDADLACLADEMLVEMYDIDGNHLINKDLIKSKIDISYHNSAREASNINNPGIASVQEINLNSTSSRTIYVRYKLCDDCYNGKPCYTIKPIVFNLINTAINNVQLQVCRTSDGEQFVSNLARFNAQLVDNPKQFQILYFESQAEAQDNNNAIDSYTFTGNDDLWVKIISKNNVSQSICLSNTGDASCEQIHKVNFIFGALVDPINMDPIIINDVCDNNNDLKEIFDLTSLEASIYSGNATFAYYLVFDENNYTVRNPISKPTMYEIVGNAEISTTSARDVVYVKVDYEGNACSDIIALDITLNFSPPIIVEDGFLCDCFPTPGTYGTFNLENAIERMFNNQVNANGGNAIEHMNIQFYEQLDEAETGVNEILLTQSFRSTMGEQIVYVKFTNQETGCYTIGNLYLKNLRQPKPNPGIMKVCDNNFNGKPDVLLSDIHTIIMSSPEMINLVDNFFYNYFWTQEDAEFNENPILGDSYSPYDVTAPTSSTFYEFEGDFPEYLWVKVESDNNSCPQSEDNSGSFCSAVVRVQLTQGQSIVIDQLSYQLDPICDTFIDTGLIGEPTYNDGISAGIDLTQYADEIISSVLSNVTIEELLYYKSIEDMQSEIYPFGQNAIATNNLTNFTNMAEDNAAIEKVYVKVKTLEYGWCPVLVELNMNVIPGPSLIPQPNYYLCPGGTTDIILDNPDNVNLNNFDINWTLPDGTVVYGQHMLENANQVGQYTVSITDRSSGCQTPTYQFKVSEVQPPEILQLIVTNESEIEVIATGNSLFTLEYSLDGIHYQSSNIFTNLDYGVYYVWVRYQENDECISDPKRTVLFEIYNVITPNGDGYNDVFFIKDLDVFEGKESILIIYDRYGKEIYHKAENTLFQWNGSYLGRPLNTGDYWYKLILPDGRVKSGHITVKNQ